MPPHCVPRTMINKNPETDIGVRKTKQPVSGSSLYLTLNGDPASRNLGMRLCVRAVFAPPPVLYSSLVLGLKACTTTAWFLWQTNMATGIKGIYHHYLVCKVGQWGCFTL